MEQSGLFLPWAKANSSVGLFLLKDVGILGKVGGWASLVCALSGFD